MTVEFTLPASLEAHEPPEARGRTRDGVRLLVSQRATGAVSHHAFRDLPSLLDPGDLLVVNTSSTLPAAVRLDRISVHFSTRCPAPTPGCGSSSCAASPARPATPTRAAPRRVDPATGRRDLTLVKRRTDRLWEARLSADVVPYLRRHGMPIRYGYVRRDWPSAAYQTAFAYDRSTGSAEMPSAARPFTPELVARLVSRRADRPDHAAHRRRVPEAHEPRTRSATASRRRRRRWSGTSTPEATG